MLIARQKPDSTNVAGIRTWNSLGRFVKRGEKGILILAPMVGNRRSRQNEIATDIDTDNAELPTLTAVKGDVGGYRDRLFEFVQS